MRGINVTYCKENQIFLDKKKLTLQNKRKTNQNTMCAILGKESLQKCTGNDIFEQYQ